MIPYPPNSLRPSILYFQLHSQRPYAQTLSNHWKRTSIVCISSDTNGSCYSKMCLLCAMRRHSQTSANEGFELHATQNCVLAKLRYFVGYLKLFVSIGSKIKLQKSLTTFKVHTVPLQIYNAVVKTIIRKIVAII